MLQDLSTPLYVLFGAACVTLLTRVRWPKVPLPQIWWPRFKVQTEHQICHGIRVTDIVLSVSGQRRRGTNAGNSQPAFEGAVYLVWKRKK
jgi:hypothetical protein